MDKTDRMETNNLPADEFIDDIDPTDEDEDINKNRSLEEGLTDNDINNVNIEHLTTPPRGTNPLLNGINDSPSTLPGFLQTIPERDNEDDDISSLNSFAARSSTLGGIETVKNNSLKKWWHVMGVKSKPSGTVSPYAKSDSSALAGVGCESDVAGAAEGSQVSITNADRFPTNTSKSGMNQRTMSVILFVAFVGIILILMAIAFLVSSAFESSSVEEPTSPQQNDEEFHINIIHTHSPSFAPVIDEKSPEVPITITPIEARKPPTNAPTMKPTLFVRERLPEITENILMKTVQTYYPLFSPSNNTAHFQAWDWLVSKDNSEIIQKIISQNGIRDVEDERALVQRIMLIIVCIRVGFTLPANGWPLQATDYSDSTLFSNSHECRWKGIKCFTETLNGTETFNMTKKTIIQSIDFNANFLSGTLPYELNYFADSLTVLSMYENFISGTLDAISLLRRLNWLDLGKNKLSGPIHIHNFPKLAYLYLNGNQLTGNLPFPHSVDTEGGDISYVDGDHTIVYTSTLLRDIWLQKNLLKGSIPSGISGLSNLQTLRIFDNNLSSIVPSSISKLTKLEYLDLSYNNLSQNLPESFFTLIQLQELYMSENQFTGEIFEQLHSLTNLSHLWVSYMLIIF